MIDSVSVGKPEPWPEGDKYLLYLGTLVGHYHSLEFVLRAYLQAQPEARPVGLERGTSPYDFPVGSTLPESELTSYDSLGDLIKKVNSAFREKGLEQIDSNILKVRDALAHGRISSPGPSADMRLVKFGRGGSGTVKVEFNESISISWLDEKRKAVSRLIMRIASELPAHNKKSRGQKSRGQVL